jgi:hypothetical protein
MRIRLVAVRKHLADELRKFPRLISRRPLSRVISGLPPTSFTWTQQDSAAEMPNSISLALRTAQVKLSRKKIVLC